eukprot:31176-Pelagococcus_subviridis.AAC.73
MSSFSSAPRRRRFASAQRLSASLIKFPFFFFFQSPARSLRGSAQGPKTPKTPKTCPPPARRHSHGREGAGLDRYSPGAPSITVRSARVRGARSTPLAACERSPRRVRGRKPDLLFFLRTRA